MTCCPLDATLAAIATTVGACGSAHHHSVGVPDWDYAVFRFRNGEHRWSIADDLEPIDTLAARITHRLSVEKRTTRQLPPMS